MPRRGRQGPGNQLWANGGTLVNTLIFGPGESCSSGDFSNGIVSLGHNLDSGHSCGFSRADDLSDVDPLLAQTTMALFPGSPAIDAGDDSVCPATDYRNVPRPGGAACDIGAFEAHY